eukprot:CAMPEP_0197068918 /NCGR_PEP_ID=MMETSP1384-20130603/189756_1 /TAXON_ID=29189 /ORGANISM="Ammonia sp." /LENGTH=65 /DNA_ID=CAMNT_0042506809 /DNA_START=20 /DNA_END=214 /DNA_ORIENTATION=+
MTTAALNAVLNPSAKLSDDLMAVRAFAKVPIIIPTQPARTEVPQPTMKAMTVNTALIHESDIPNT